MESIILLAMNAVNIIQRISQVPMFTVSTVKLRVVPIQFGKAKKLSVDSLIVPIGPENKQRSRFLPALPGSIATARQLSNYYDLGHVILLDKYEFSWRCSIR